MCFTNATERYHHWSVFAPSLHGIRFKFHKLKLEKALEEESDDIIFRDVDYKKIYGKKIQTEDLPFVKRIPYKDEKEFRIVYKDCKHNKDTHDVKIPLDAISAITLSPWIPKPLENSIQETLKGITCCESMKIYRSTLIENEKWKKKAML